MLNVVSRLLLGVNIQELALAALNFKGQLFKKDKAITDGLGLLLNLIISLVGNLPPRYSSANSPLKETPRIILNLEK